MEMEVISGREIARREIAMKDSRSRAGRQSSVLGELAVIDVKPENAYGGASQKGQPSLKNPEGDASADVSAEVRATSDMSSELMAEEALNLLDAVPTVTVELGPESRIASMSDAQSPGADRYRMLRMRLRVLRESSPLKSLLITSALPKDGKSLVSLNLATTLARDSKSKVLLVDGDLHCPSLSKTLRIERSEGLAECLSSPVDPLGLIRKVLPLGFYFLQPGMAHEAPSELLQAGAIAGLLKRLGSYFDWLLIDSPPVAVLSDAVVLSRQTDAVIFVARAHQTSGQAVADALGQLGTQKIAGIVFNAEEGLSELYSKYSGYYGRK